ncbi:MAG: hypothetical protein U1E25_06460 [Methylocystis sp.]
MYFKDLSNYDYIPEYAGSPPAKNVGWLATNRRFRKSAPTERFLNRLWAFCKIQIVLTRGIHSCPFCGDYSFDASFYSHGEETLLLGSAEMRVFDADGITIYAAPNLIFHYVEAHLYAPPERFVDGVLNGPLPDQQYFEKLYKPRLKEVDPATNAEFARCLADAKKEVCQKNK